MLCHKVGRWCLSHRRVRPTVDSILSAERSITLKKIQESHQSRHGCSHMAEWKGSESRAHWLDRNDSRDGKLYVKLQVKWECHVAAEWGCSRVKGRTLRNARFSSGSLGTCSTTGSRFLVDPIFVLTKSVWKRVHIICSSWQETVYSVWRKAVQVNRVPDRKRFEREEREEG